MLSDAGPDPVARRFGALESDLCTLLSAAADQMTWSCHPHSTCRSSSWLAAAARAGCGQRPTTTVRRRRAAPRLLQERRKRKQVRAQDRRRPQVRRRLQNWRRLQSMCSLQSRSGERPKTSAHCEPVADLTLGHVCKQQVQQGAVTLGPLPALAAPPPSVLPISVMRALSQSVSTWPVGFQPGVMMQPSPVQPEAYSAVRSLCCTLLHRSALRALTPDPLMFFWLPRRAKTAAELLAAGCRVRPSRAPSLPKTPSGGRWRRRCLACRCCRGPTTHVPRPARARSRPERRRSACAPTDGVSAGPAPRRGSLVCRDQGHHMRFKRTPHAARACGWSARVVSRTSEDIVAGRRIVRFWRDPTTQDVCWTSITAAAYSSLPPSQQQCTDVSCIFWCVAWSLSFFPGIRKPHLTPVPLRVSCPGIARATLSLQALTACAWCSSCWAAR